ncbi:VOC family protein [Azospirillum rugosum]|uniref:Catechol 2,3-dioxygenase-like lactoylglutathione lyase family enzyme n=1 Tax=Azospirillum rugosum TaxID=416170 RepID=A0ABS4STQ8_9PROT|nr:VOC family protein [Azospirillum rugosum]MBP2295624.1 catechol 2,3-dioxygenase-like lactoylglutathione lyase family enzyme [Azospirillum rugosum]MDQ0529486.1 catechol 2,3-dioxygenase-like lactoylglutathione lyase family enzyme [Azospirillum rugosum]
MPSFDHVNISVRDLDRAIRFYGETFGLTLMLRQTLSGDWFDAIRGTEGAVADCAILVDAEHGLRIEMLCFPQPQPGPGGMDDADMDKVGIGHFAITVDDIDAVRERAIRAGATPVGAVVEVPRSILPKGKRMCYLRDPDGILLELAQRISP